MANFEESRKQRLLRHTYIFAQTNDLMELAEMYIDIQKIFKEEDFPIESYETSKQRRSRKRVIANRKYKPR